MPNKNGLSEVQLEIGPKDISSCTAEDGACEIPETKPFEGFSYIKKTWVDSNEGLIKVMLHVTFGCINKPPDWGTTQKHEMMPEWGTEPLQRSWVIRIPTHFENEEKYLLHYFFIADYKNGDECISQNYTQLIVPKTIQYIDHSGLYSHIKLHWSLDGWSYPQSTELEFTDIEWGSEYSVSHSPYRQGDRLYERGRAAIISQAQTPRIFTGTIWAPHNEKVNYCFNLISIDQTSHLMNKWDNNNGINYKLTI